MMRPEILRTEAGQSSWPSPEKGSSMQIQNVRLSAEQLSSNKWRLTVRYIAVFDPVEVNPPLNFTFRDGFQIWEDDPVNDDQLTGYVALSNFNPAGTVVQRVLSHDISGDTLDTEIGGEEIKVKLRLRNVNLNFAIHKWSGTISLAP
jgi:hypothetical protein